MIVHFACLKSEQAFIIQKGANRYKEQGWENFQEKENVMTVIRGLEGVVATTSSVSSIIDDTLTYVGYNIDDLAENATFEEVVYLLWHRKLPNEKN